MENTQQPAQPGMTEARKPDTALAVFLKKPLAVYCVIGWLALYALINVSGAWAVHQLKGYHDLATEYNLLRSLDFLSFLLLAAAVCNLALAATLYARSRIFRVVTIIVLCLMAVNNVFSMGGPQGYILPVFCLAGNLAAIFILSKTGWFFTRKDSVPVAR